jgi:hypothetical protein
MAVGGVGALIALVMLAGLALLVMALVDLVRRPTEIWASSGHNQLVWALLVVFVAFVGPLLYLLIARPALESASLGRGEKVESVHAGTR